MPTSGVPHLPLRKADVGATEAKGRGLEARTAGGAILKKIKFIKKLKKIVKNLLKIIKII